ncbi:MAG: PAS domain-containing sensor histidine kinase [Actinobacteria bacterium]|nr:PAS domain-containing sensor histidine kinase [Actinomycetota bacterium]
MEESKARPRFGEEWLVAVLDALSEGVVAIDGAGRLSAANPAAETLLGFDVSVRRFAHWTELLPRVLRDAEGRFVDPHPVARALAGEPTPVTPYEIGDGDWWELATHLLDPVAGAGSGVVVTFREVTARIRAQRDRELASEILREVLAMTTHDLRGPIMTISGYAGLLSQTHATEDPELRTSLEAIRRQTEHLTKLVSDLSLTARIEAGALEAEPTAVALAHLVDEALTVAALPDISIDIPPRLELLVDPDHGRRILLNLLENARKYGAPPYAVMARRDGAMVETVVADAGAGVPDELVPRLFDRYSRSAPPGVEGTGLGLAIVAKLAELNGGTVRYEVGDHDGTRFVVRLPAAGSDPRRVDADSVTGPTDERLDA